MRWPVPNNKLGLGSSYEYIVGVKLFGVLLLVAGSLCAQTTRGNLDDGFDKPLKKTVVDLGPSPYYKPTQHVRKTLTCYSYSEFTVKQYDEGQKGAEWLSIVRSAHASCTRKHSNDERVYTYPEWSGYFWGVKGQLVFFSADDGYDGGMPFAVFDVGTGRKLFEDSSVLEYYEKKLNIRNAFRVTNGADHDTRLTYFRVAHADCNLNTNEADCWPRVRAKLGIIQTDIPVCTRYEQGDGESVVVYPVSVLLSGSPTVKALKGPVFCWPTD